MQIKRVFISLLLLFAYSFGQAHSLIPHCHHEEGAPEHLVEKAIVHNHDHHVHNSDDLNNHEHISHDDHVDLNIMDYILCILSESEPCTSDENHCYYVPAKTNNHSSNLLPNVKFIAHHLDNLNEDDDDKFIVKQPEVSTSYRSPLLSTSPNRGPPVFSC